MTGTTVGFIGLGLMGQGMASNLLNKGFALTIMAHRNREPLEALVTRGAVEVEDPFAMAQCSTVVLLCLPGSQEVCSVLTGPRGLLAGLRPGQLVIDCSTGDPSRTREIDTLVREAGGRYMDAPVNRTPKEAAEGRLNGLVGGSDADVEQARPILQAFCETLHHLGVVGSGHKAKVIHNFIAQGNAAILAEAFCAAAKNGLDLRAFADICRLSGGHSRTFDRIIPFVLEGDDNGQRFALANCEKDMRYYTDLARATPTTGPVADAVYQTFLLAKSLGHGDKYVPHLFDVQGQINGTQVRAELELNG
ncbi:NAD(P)-dependent oxidoreductase [Pseudomonas sp. GD03817]|uniref:6-phosphogluconate dehydrogenase n=1 Tax=Pseudomonas putida TaxID=303 RepID=A0A1L5PSQ2_PSEPU|nr:MULTISPECIES: NAD(P)-dependent oxidoreductase [Pseudomonas]APO83212.1 6-phosphogluconate dehydrogenase [Pseudomonas putida]MBA6136197.1 NAD(P)-dependent oxidoreductase [Pseudomonas monteilii]MBF8806353.1 NAD(P)-dependent oxidoreductase [Pseudomonas asiatica]MCE0989523.1 NAD(P)-dependent oxidoreductase [Pseudomonas alloputida]MCE1060675.1 NAD(P)-dependent oxidoreductase [Pseudomonas alloputida]